MDEIEELVDEVISCAISVAICSEWGTLCSSARKELETAKAKLLLKIVQMTEGKDDQLHAL